MNRLYLIIFFINFILSNEYNLDSLIKIGLENSPSINLAVEELKKARANSIEARSTALPKVQIFTSGTKNFNIAGQPISFPIFPGLLDQFGNPVSNDSLSYFQATGLIMSEIDLPMGTDYSGVFGINFNQTLFDGRVFAAIRASKIYDTYTEESYNEIVEKVIENIKISFYSVLLTKKVFKVFKKSLERAKSNFKNTELLFESGNVNELELIRAEESLQNTPNLLPILKKSGVVDSGAQGFVDLLNGIFYFINSGSIKNLKIQTFFLDESEKNSSEIHSNELKYNFCTECLINGDDIDRKKVREELMAFGDSLVIAGSKSKAKIHIHTNEPAKVFNYCSKYGIVSDQKTDDMSQQQASAGGQSLQKIAILTDSGADLPPESDSLNIHVVPVRYHFGNIGYIDKVSQSPQEFFQELKVNPIHPKTSQPTPGDFRRQYNYLSSHYKSVISPEI